MTFSRNSVSRIWLHYIPWYKSLTNAEVGLVCPCSSQLSIHSTRGDVLFYSLWVPGSMLGFAFLRSEFVLRGISDGHLAGKLTYFPRPFVPEPKNVCEKWLKTSCLFSVVRVYGTQGRKPFQYRWALIQQLWQWWLCKLALTFPPSCGKWIPQ